MIGRKLRRRGFKPEDFAISARRSLQSAPGALRDALLPARSRSARFSASCVDDLAGRVVDLMIDRRELRVISDKHAGELLRFRIRRGRLQLCCRARDVVAQGLRAASTHRL